MKPGPLARREARLARAMLAPTVATVMAIVLLPLAATFWISVKPVELADLRPPTPVARERLRGDLNSGDGATIEYRLRNSSATRPIRNVVLRDAWPEGLRILSPDPRCRIAESELTCEFGEWPPGHRERLRLQVAADPLDSADSVDSGTASERTSSESAGGVSGTTSPPTSPTDSRPTMSGDSQGALTSSEFTWKNFARVFDGAQFVSVLKITFFYTFFGTAGALVAGLFAAQLLNRPFRGRAVFRGVFLFPYVAPVIAMAYTWLVVLNPSSGALNELLQRMGTIDAPINFFGTRNAAVEMFGMRMQFPLALTMVTAFEVWRYFPLSLLFILARMQSEPEDIREAAEMDGATPFQQFRHLGLPQLAGILSALFLLRFIWTFNKFDDIFLLTGGAAGTRTLTVSVYERGFALGDLGAGCAAAVVIFVLLFLFAAFHFRVASREEGL